MLKESDISRLKLIIKHCDRIANNIKKILGDN